MRHEPEDRRGPDDGGGHGEITLFLIGMRINSFWRVRHWWPVLMAMPRMLRELSADPDSGMLGYRLLLGGPRYVQVVQYWSSHERLLAYASAPEGSTARPGRRSTGGYARAGAAWASGTRPMWCRPAPTSPST